MARERFFQSVRTAAKFLAPRVDNGAALTKEHWERALRKAVIWLTPKSVEGFEPDDFEGATRTELERDVAEFRKIANEASRNGPATKEQIDAAIPLFHNILSKVLEILNREWTEAVNQLMSDAKKWCLKHDWPVKQHPKSVVADFVSPYPLHRLVFAVEGKQMVLNPVAGMVPGADGLVELAVLPDYDSVSVLRHGDKWQINRSPADKKDWSEAAFVESARDLARSP